MSQSSQTPDRRSFLKSLATIGFAAKIKKSQKESEKVWRFLTPECDVQMSVEYFAQSAARFRFRERLSDTAFCLSENGEKDGSCLERFRGSMAIVHYHFRSRPHAQMPVKLRERVVTIDHDSRIDPRPPFEKVLSVEQDVVSDIQAFGYNQDNPDSGSKPLGIWCLLRQDLYLDDQFAAFLTVHWKHSIDFIDLLDVIPGERTQWVGG